MFRKCLRISWSIAALAALSLNAGSTSGQRLAPKPEAATVSLTTFPKLSARNVQGNVPFRGHRFILHGYPASDRTTSPGKAQQLINGGPSSMRIFQVTAGRTHAGARPEVDQALDEVITGFRAQGPRL